MAKQLRAANILSGSVASVCPRSKVNDKTTSCFRHLNQFQYPFYHSDVHHFMLSILVFYILFLFFCVFTHKLTPKAVNILFCIFTALANGAVIKSYITQRTNENEIKR
jgi:hypothetical protein